MKVNYRNARPVNKVLEGYDGDSCDFTLVLFSRYV